MGIAGAPVQVRNPDAARVETRNGPFHDFRLATRWLRSD